MKSLYYVVRPQDGLIVSIPASYRIAEGVALYLASVTEKHYYIFSDGVRVSTVKP
jgi:hypothetical protein